MFNLNLIHYRKTLKLFKTEFKKVNLYLKKSPSLKTQELRSLAYALSNIYLIFNKIDKIFTDYDRGVWWFSNLCYLLDNLFYFIRDICKDEKVLELCNCYLKNQTHFQIKFLRKLVSHPFNIDPILEKDFNFITRDTNIFNVIYVNDEFWKNSDDQMQVIIIKNRKWLNKNFSNKRFFNKNGIIFAIESITSKKSLYLEVNLALLIDNFVNLMTNEIFKKIKFI